MTENYFLKYGFALLGKVVKKRKKTKMKNERSFQLSQLQKATQVWAQHCQEQSLLNELSKLQRY